MDQISLSTPNGKVKSVLPPQKSMQARILCFDSIFREICIDRSNMVQDKPNNFQAHRLVIVMAEGCASDQIPLPDKASMLDEELQYV
ncbi:hypothetical protein SLS64_001833 [Diaporthe eres]